MSVADSLFDCLHGICFIAGMYAIDGGTFGLDYQGEHLRFRLWGIDASETIPPGRHAKASLASLLDGDAVLRCDMLGQDRHRHEIVDCDVSVISQGYDARPIMYNLSCAMVHAGMAKDWPEESGGAFADALKHQWQWEYCHTKLD